MVMIMRTKKILTKIRLINWHYFSDETITVSGSFLVSGENGSGKSTLLDAIQLVLTTNTRRFNPAANEKSKRDLRGYVRGKTGEEGKEYLRKDKSVISYVALEFYEESRNRYFVIGVRLESPDFESEIKKKWFVEEASLDAITFTENGRPLCDKRFVALGKPISLIPQTSEAQERFRVRLGHLGGTFFDMIQKSLAFKPMNNIKDFITKFILPERQIDVATLRENITHLRELQELIEEVTSQISELDAIIKNYEDITKINGDIRIIDILLKKAELENLRSGLKGLEEKIAETELALVSAKAENTILKSKAESDERTLTELKAAMQSNECAQLIGKLKNDIHCIDLEIAPIEDKVGKLREQSSNLERALQASPELCKHFPIAEVRALIKSEGMLPEKQSFVLKIASAKDRIVRTANEEKAKLSLRAVEISGKIERLEKEIRELELGRVTYPDYVTKLKCAIEEELRRRKIESPVRITADLIEEVTAPEWQNAAEGYLGTKRFTIITEPAAYKIAAEVYERNKETLHTVEIADTLSLDATNEPPEVVDGSIVNYLRLSGKYAEKYLLHILGQVKCVDTIKDFEDCEFAVTQDCTAYRNKAIEVIDPETYRLPYIGKKARQLQLETKRSEHASLTEERAIVKDKIDALEKELHYIGKCNLDTLQDTLTAPHNLAEKKKARREKEIELKEAEANPGYIELGIKLDTIEKELAKEKEEENRCRYKIINLERDINDYNENKKSLTEQIEKSLKDYGDITRGYEDAGRAAEEKYKEHIKSEDAGTIQSNFAPRKQTLINQRTHKERELIEKQAKYRGGEFGTGIDLITAYAEESERLRKYELVKYQDKLGDAKQRCELEFRESFLAKMRENIENAQIIFKDLNKSLKNVRYGKDAYRFLCTGKKEKQGLVNMITSEFNLGADALFSQQFESEFKGEMDDLFLKLTQSDTLGDAVLREYTDYREYLDYDIQINSEGGAEQYFSKIYGEKSGGETQTPYYVAIAASFSQLYNYGETIRIIMLDEAFDKMDDERIQSMMQFFKEQGFQIILATPPGKMEIIGEHVDTILIAYREGHQTTIDEYKL